MEHHIRMGATRDGKLTALLHEGWEVTSPTDIGARIFTPTGSHRDRPELRGHEGYGSDEKATHEERTLQSMRQFLVVGPAMARMKCSRRNSPTEGS